MRDFYRMGKDEVAKGEKEPPYAYVVTADQRDPNTSAKMINLLIDQGAEVQQADTEFTADGVTYPKGSYVLLMAQPFRPFVKDIMEPQKYPDLRAFPGGPPIPPYDVAGWTLPLQMGVASSAVKDKFSASLRPVTQAEVPKPAIGASGATAHGFLLSHEPNDSMIAVNRLLKAGVEVRWSQTDFTNGGKHYGAGTILIPPGAARQAKSITQNLSLPLIPASEAVNVATAQLKPLRLALYNPWGGNMDEGWTRLILEQFEFPYKEIRNSDITSDDFAKDFDVVVFSDQQPASIMNGISEKVIQPEYAGGIGNKGLENVKDFVRNGGTVIALGNATALLMKAWSLPVTDVLAGLKTTDFFCPGSILAVQVDNTHPVGFGMPENTSAFFARSSAFEIQPSYFAPGGQVRTVVKYADDHVLQSGWILGETRLQNRAAAVDVTMDKGHVMLFGFRVQNRAQPHATFKLFFNSLYYGSAKPVTSSTPARTD
jgi:hypothetical protein